ncbi:hypothetical protein SR187_0340 [Streptococcus ruminantium]|uniref:Uncharacterized protein n=1 Tax=Streptococcus ruminantium TaxID=1917441 RepID=A0A2Z5TTF5_9STRE|nr:hypothetical protein SR187_0325 [Streptococcus ruminantium]BBA91715.1 hypothetical protein SR187_0340 [Streptococcus ruminantium]
MKKFFKGLFAGSLYTSYILLLAWSLLHLEKLPVENGILLIVLTYYINKQNLFKRLKN